MTLNQIKQAEMSFSLIKVTDPFSLSSQYTSKKNHTVIYFISLMMCESFCLSLVNGLTATVTQTNQIDVTIQLDLICETKHTIAVKYLKSV